VSRIGAFLAAAISSWPQCGERASADANGFLFQREGSDGLEDNGEEKWIVQQGTILCEECRHKYGS